MTLQQHEEIGIDVAFDGVGVRRIAWNTVAVYTSSTARLLIGVVVQILVARQLGATGLGQYGLLLAYLQVFRIVCEFGLPFLSIREVARRPMAVGQYFAVVWRLELAFGVLAWLALAGLAVLLRYPSDTQRLLLIGGASLVPYALSSAVATALQAQERMLPMAVLDILNVAVLGLLSAALLWQGHGVYALAVTIVLAQGVAAAVGWGWLQHLHRWSIARWDGVLARRLLAKSWRFFLLTGIAVLVGRLDVIILSRWVSDTLLGLYTAGLMYIRAVNVLAESYSVAMYPALARLYGGDRDRYVRSATAFATGALLLVLPFAVLGSVLSEPVIALIFGHEQYRLAVLILRIGAWYVVPFALNSILGRFLLSSDHELANLAVSISRLGIATLGCLLLIPRWGPMGALAAIMTASLLGMALNWRLLRKRVPDLRIEVPFGRLAVAAGLMGLSAFLLREWWLLSLGISLATYGVAVYLTGLVRDEELKMIRSWIGRGM